MAAGERTLTVRILGDAKGAQDAFGQVEKAGKNIAGTLAKVGLAVGAALGGAAVAAFKIGESFDKASDTIRVGTGATGKALKDLEGSFKTVLKTVPTSFDDAGSAIADLNTRLGLTGKPLESLAGQFLNLSRITKTDLKTNVDNLTRVFGDWGIATDEQASSLDKVYRAAQASGIGLEDLSTSVVQFGAPLRNLGFGLDESLALLAQFNKTGVNTETVFAGLKAGVGKLAKAGEDVPTTFKRIVSEITKMGPGTEATGLAIKLFGQRAGPDLADAIAGGKFEVNAMLDAIAGGEDTIAKAAKDTEDFGEKWLRIKNRVLVALEPIATRVFDAVGDGMDKVGAAAERWGPIISEKVGGAFVVLRGHAEDTFSWIKVNVIPVVESIARVFVDDVLPALVAASGFIKGTTVVAVDLLTAAFKFLKDKIEPVAALIGAVVIPKIIALGVEATVSAAKQVAAWATTAVQAAASGAVSVFWLTLNTAEWIKNAVMATAQAARVAAAWVVTQTAAVLSGQVTLAQVAVQIGQWVLLGVHALANAAKVAAAWVISMGPIALVIAAVAGLVALWIIHWDTIKDVIAAGARFVVDKFLGMVEWIVKGAASAFGWVPGVGPKLREAARAVEGFRDDVNRALGGINDKTINLRITEKVERIGTQGLQARAHGGPVLRGQSYIVGDGGVPELFVPKTDGYILPSVPPAAALTPAGGGAPVIVNVSVAGTVVSERDLVEAVARGLEERRRRNGPGDF